MGLREWVARKLIYLVNNFRKTLKNSDIIEYIDMFSKFIGFDSSFFIDERIFVFALHFSTGDRLKIFLPIHNPRIKTQNNAFT